MATTQLTAPQAAALTAIATGKVSVALDIEGNVYKVREIAEAMVAAGASETVKSALASVRSLSRKGLAELSEDSSHLKLTVEGTAAAAEFAPAPTAAQKRKATLDAKKAAAAALIAEAAPTKAKRAKAVKEAEPKKAPAKKAAKADDKPKSELSIKIAAAARMIADGTSLKFEDFAKGDKVQTADGKVWIVTQPALDEKTIWCRPVDGGKPIRRGWKSMTKVAS